MRGEARSAIAVRAGTVSDEQRVLWPSGKFAGDHLAVRQIDRSGDMTFVKHCWRAHIEQHEISTGRHRFMHVPAIGLERKLGSEMRFDIILVE